MLVLEIVIKNHRLLRHLATKSVAFLVVLPSRSPGLFALIFACLVMIEDAYYTVKTNEKSTFLRFGLFHAFVKRCAFGVGFACFFQLEIHAFFEGAKCLRLGWFFINFHALELTLGSRNPLGGLPGGILKNHQISIPHFLRFWPNLTILGSPLGDSKSTRSHFPHSIKDLLGAPLGALEAAF